MIAIVNVNEDKMESHTPPSSFRIGVRNLGRFVLSLPTFGFIACVLLSLIYNFEGSTATHCGVTDPFLTFLLLVTSKVPVVTQDEVQDGFGIELMDEPAHGMGKTFGHAPNFTKFYLVKNYLPSASAAIGGYTPQRYIWRISIALHCAPRFFYATLYHNHYLTMKVKSYTGFYAVFVALTTLLNVVENLCLVILTCVSSTENYDVHESSFIGFMVFSELHMLFTIVLWFWTSASQSMTQTDYNSLAMKVACFVVNLLSFGAAIYFFFRHNSYCEPGIYTWFAICEYSTIMSNIAFHGTATIDFRDRYLTVVTGSNIPMHKTKPS